MLTNNVEIVSVPFPFFFVLGGTKIQYNNQRDKACREKKYVFSIFVPLTKTALPIAGFMSVHVICQLCHIRLLANSLRRLRSPLTRLIWAKRFWSRIRSIM